MFIALVLIGISFLWVLVAIVLLLGVRRERVPSQPQTSYCFHSAVDLAKASVQLVWNWYLWYIWGKAKLFEWCLLQLQVSNRRVSHHSQTLILRIVVNYLSVFWIKMEILVVLDRLWFWREPPLVSADCEDLEQVHLGNILKVTFFGTSCRFFTYKEKGGRQNDSLQNICLAGLNIQPN